MEAADVVEILKKKLALAAGGRDLYERPIITISPDCEFTVDEMAATLQYLNSIYEFKTKRIYFIVAVDLRKVSGVKLNRVLNAVRMALIGKLNKIILIKTDGIKFKLQIDLKKESEVLGCEVICINVNKLHQIIDSKQLTREFNGTLDFDSDHWLQNRLLLEQFIKESKTASRHLSCTLLRLKTNLTLTSKTNSSEMLEENEREYSQAKQTVEKTLSKGILCINRLTTDKDSGFRRDMEINSNRDCKEAVEQIDFHYNELSNNLKELEDFWSSMEKSLLQMMEFGLLEKDMQRVVDWLLGPGENLMATQHDIGSSTSSAEDLRRQHEKIELTFTEIYGLYATLRRKANEMIENNPATLKSIEAQREYMDAVCRSFAHRLERRRNLLIMSSLFHRLVQNLFEKFCNLMEVLQEDWKLEDDEQCERLLRLIDTLQTEIDEETSEACYESEKLLDLIAIPAKNAVGNDVTPNCTYAVMHIKRICAQLQERKKHVDEGVELRRLRLRQIAKLIACEKEAAQLIECLREMSTELTTRHYLIGSNPSQTESLRTEHESFHLKARQTYELCRQLLHVALILRRSSKLNLELNTRLGYDVHRTWRHFALESQKRKTLLRNCEEFYLNIDRLLLEFDRTITSKTLGRLSEICRHLSHSVYSGRVLLNAINLSTSDNEAAQQIQNLIDESEFRLDEFRASRRESEMSSTSSTTTKLDTFQTAPSSTLLDEFRTATSEDWRTAASEATTSADELDEFYSAEENHNGLENGQRELKEFETDEGEGRSGVKVFRTVSAVKQVSQMSFSRVVGGAKPSMTASRRTMIANSVQSGADVVTRREVTSSVSSASMAEEELDANMGSLMNPDSFFSVGEDEERTTESKFENDELLRRLKEVGEQMCGMIDTIVPK